jgi:hypothetical protein
LKFHGFIDDIDMAGDNTIKISCRDQGGELQDTYIESVVTRGSGGGTAVQTVMQTIVTAAMASPPTIYVPSSPGWNILEFEQTKEPLFTAIRRLADQIGWILKYWWDSGTSAYRLTLYEPDRTVAVAMRTFGPGEYFKISKASMSRKSVRNRVVVSYRTSPEGALLDVTVNDAGSQSKYGLRYCGVTEGATSNIDSSGEATTMANAILTDLKEPTLSHTVTMPLFWPAETGDYYGFSDNHAIYDTTQNLAVFAITHKFMAGGKAETTLQLRGKPASGSRRWLNIETRPGIAPPVINRTSAAATGLATVQGAGGAIVLTYDDPRSMTPPVRTWATTKLYVSTTPGFTPGPSNLVAQNKSTRFVVENLVSGTTYYAKIQIIDGSGNVSTTSAQETIEAGYSGAMHFNPRNVADNLILNPAFNQWSSPNTKNGNAPDQWIPVNDIGAGIVVNTDLWRSTPGPYAYHEGTIIKSSDASLKIYVPTVGAAVKRYGCWQIDPVPVQGDGVYDFRFLAQETVNTTTIIGGYWYLADRTTSAGSFAYGITPVSTWVDSSVTVVAPSTARWFRALVLVREHAASNGTLYIDRLSLTLKPDSFKAYSNAQSVPQLGWEQIDYASEQIDNGSVYATPTFTAVHDGNYTFTATVGVDDLADAAQMQIAIYLNGTAEVYSVVAENNSGGVRDTYATASIATIDLNIGDTIEVYMYHNHGGNVSLLTSNKTQFSGSLLK